MKIFFLNSTLRTGGAERQLCELACGLKNRGHEVVIGLFYSGGLLEKDIEAHGIKIFHLGKRNTLDNFIVALRLLKILKKEKPDILQCWMNVPNVHGALLKPYISPINLVWAIRSSDMDVTCYNITDRIVYYIERKLSRIPELVISNSNAGKEYFISKGAYAGNIIVIPSGINVKNFQPDASAREQCRKQWGINKEKLIGIVGRIDPKKGHETFFRAVSIIARNNTMVRFACVSPDPQLAREKFHSLVESMGLENTILWVSGKDNIVKIYNAIDIFCLSSHFGEGWPNVVGEAMACGVPCVVTDVGDAGAIVGDTGIVVPRRNPSALAEACIKLLNLSDEQFSVLKTRCRERIVENFTVEKMAERFESVYNSILLGNNKELINE